MSGEVETELKFTLGKDALRAVRAAVRALVPEKGAAKDQRIRSVYYDTADRRLRAAGASLRLRTVDGRTEQTVKLAGDGSGLSARPEFTVEAPGPHPDLGAFPDSAAARTLKGMLDGAPVSPVFTVEVRRLSLEIAAPGDSVIEIAIDEGAVAAGRKRSPLRELELELKEGDLRTLFPLARKLLDGVPVRFGRWSKAGQGWRLVDGETDGSPAKATPVLIPKSATVEEAMRSVLRSCTAQVLANAGAIVDGDDPEGPHQLRVGLRRLRSALKIFAPAVDEVVAGRLSAGARDLGRAVGRVRDLDVLAIDIVAPCADGIDVGALEALLKTRRDEARQTLSGILDGAEAGGFLIDLVAFTEGRGWLSTSDVGQSAALAEPARAFARRVLAERWQKAALMGSEPGTLTPEERHELRKSFKTLRYSLEFLGSLVGRKKLRRALREVRTAQDVLGYLNDVRNARQLVGLVEERPSGRGRRDPAAPDRALGYCLGWHEARAGDLWARAAGSVKLDPDPPF